MNVRVLVALALSMAACGGSAKPPPEPPGTGIATDRVLVLVNVDAEGVGLGGHDPISYTKGDAPAAGTADHASKHGGATYRFASAEHKATFDADGQKYAPQFGGYCAYAASQNRLSPSDPQVWRIVDGKLLVFTNLQFRELFDKDPTAHKRKADENWPGLLAKHGKRQAP